MTVAFPEQGKKTSYPESASPQWNFGRNPFFHLHSLPACVAINTAQPSARFASDGSNRIMRPQKPYPWRTRLAVAALLVTAGFVLSPAPVQAGCGDYPMLHGGHHLSAENFAAPSPGEKTDRQSTEGPAPHRSPTK